MGIKLEGLTGAGVEVAGTNQLKVITETDASTNPNNVGGVRIFGENDQGLLTGVTRIRSTEVDADYRQRVSYDLMLDEEVFSYVAQNTGKHSYLSTTLTNTWAAGQMTTNAASSVATTVGSVFQTYASFPTTGTTTLSADTEIGFSAQPATNTFIEWGVGIPGAATVAPTDGVFFRLSSAGLQGVASNNGTETSTGVFPLAGGAGTWVYQNNKKYQFIVYLGGVEAQFWVNDGTGAVLLGAIQSPAGQGRMTMGAGLPYFIKQRIVGGAASGVMQAFIGAYSVRQGGGGAVSVPSTQGNRMYGSYRGMSGGVMGSLASYANSTNPTAAVPTNTTAALGSGLCGQFWETDTLAVTVDGIIASYQVPPLSVSSPNRRLVVLGIKIQSYVQTVIVGGGYVANWSLAFGHTAVSLATAESASSKAPCRIPLGIHGVPAAAAANSTLGDIVVDFRGGEVFVNPGEFIQIVKKKVGTAPTAGAIAHNVIITFGWE
jgi:hypothetical protein